MKWSRLYLGMIVFFGHPVFAQTGLESCGIKLNEAMMNLAKQDTGTDPRAKEKLAMIVQDWEACAGRSKVPSFSTKDLQDRLIDSQSIKGKIVVINFWFSTCAPCVAEIPGLNKLVEKYQGRNVLFLGFSFEGKQRIQEDFLPVHPFDFTIVPDAGSLEKIFGVSDYPSTFIVDKAGRVRKAWSGGKTGPEAKDEVYARASEVIDGIMAEK